MGDARSEERKHFVVGGNFCELFNFGDVAHSDKLTFPIIEKETFKCQIEHFVFFTLSTVWLVGWKGHF